MIRIFIYFHASTNCLHPTPSSASHPVTPTSFYRSIRWPSSGHLHPGLSGFISKTSNMHSDVPPMSTFLILSATPTYLCLLSSLSRPRLNKIIIISWRLHQAFNQNGPVGCAWRLFFFSQTRAKKEEEAVRDQVKKLSDPCRGVTGLLLSVKNKAFWVYHHQYEWIMLSMCVLWVPWKAHHKSKLLLWLLQ